MKKVTVINGDDIVASCRVDYTYSVVVDAGSLTVHPAGGSTKKMIFAPGTWTYVGVEEE